MSKNLITIVLASSSKARKSLMNRLQIPYMSFSPDIDESAYSGESTQDLVLRLAREKAQAIAPQYPHALIIGCDQTAECEGVQLNKPHHFDKAVEQLLSISGKRVQFILNLPIELATCFLDGYMSGDGQAKSDNSYRATSISKELISGLCLLNTHTHNIQQHIEITDTYFKKLTRMQIEHYVHTEQPYECCGSIKSEGLGFALIEKIISNDPTSLIGMPMIALINMLHNEGFEVV